MMKRFVVLIIVLVALSVANAQQTRQVRVPRTPKSLQQKSEDYKNRAIPNTQLQRSATLKNIRYPKKPYLTQYYVFQYVLKQTSDMSSHPA